MQTSIPISLRTDGLCVPADAWSAPVEESEASAMQEDGSRQWASPRRWSDEDFDFTSEAPGQSPEAWDQALGSSAAAGLSPLD